MLSAKKLESEKNIKITVVNISSLPYDEESFKKILKEHKKILVVEDHFNIGGIYDEIIKSLYKNKFLADIKHISVHDYAQAADPNELYKSYKMDEISIFNTICEWK